MVLSLMVPPFRYVRIRIPSVDSTSALQCSASSSSPISARARAAARLIDCGIPLSQLNKRHFHTKTLRRLQVESAIVRSMELLDGGRTALAFISLDLLAQTGADERDLDDIANFVGQIEGVCNAATLRELSPGRCKLSLRTDPAVLNANHVCALLGGGGHAAAAGATMEGTLQQAREAVLRAIEQVQAHG